MASPYCVILAAPEQAAIAAFRARSDLPGRLTHAQRIPRLHSAWQRNGSRRRRHHWSCIYGIVTALTEKIINPLLGALIGKPNFGYLIAHINGGEIRYGDFLTAIINFLLIAAVVYFFLVLPTQYLLKKFHPAEAPPATKACPQCLSDIPVAATRCKFCTQPVNA